jgi:hypothetical protein
MKTRFRRAISQTQHCISLILVTDQDQQRVGRQRYIRREALRSNLFGREILPTDEKLHAAFVQLRNRFRVWIARAKPRFVMRLIQNAVDRGAIKYYSKLRVR